MTVRGSAPGSSGGGQIPPGFAGLSHVLPAVAVPALAFLWWALAFLPWTRGRHPVTLVGWPPTLPVLFTDLEVAVFGSLGASLVVIALLRRLGLAFVSILLGVAVAAVVTLSGGAAPSARVTNETERFVMLAICGLAAFAGLGIGVVAIRSLRAFGFLGLLAVLPVASLVAALGAGAGATPDLRWPTRLALAVLLGMIAWRRWSDALLWPYFFVLFWALNLVRLAVRFGAQTLSHPGGSQATIWSVADSVGTFIRSAWLDVLRISWDVFWPAAAVVALAVAGRYVFHRFPADGS